jgi:hypothetical protein
MSEGSNEIEDGKEPGRNFRLKLRLIGRFGLRSQIAAGNWGRQDVFGSSRGAMMATFGGCLGNLDSPIYS